MMGSETRVSGYNKTCPRRFASDPKRAQTSTRTSISARPAVMLRDAPPGRILSPVLAVALLALGEGVEPMGGGVPVAAVVAVAAVVDEAGA